MSNITKFPAQPTATPTTAPRQIPVQDNKIVIRIKNGEARVNYERPMPFEDLLSALCTILLGAMNQIVDQVPQKHKDECKGALYDASNCMFSGILEKFAPEFELRPGLTAQAILEAENKIIMEGRLKDVEPHT